MIVPTLRVKSKLQNLKSIFKNTYPNIFREDFKGDFHSWGSIFAIRRWILRSPKCTIQQPCFPIQTHSKCIDFTICVLVWYTTDHCPTSATVYGWKGCLFSEIFRCKGLFFVSDRLVLTRSPFSWREAGFSCYLSTYGSWNTFKLIQACRHSGMLPYDLGWGS